MPKINLDTSLKPHATLGLIISLWLVLFLVFVGPYDGADLTLKIRLILMPPYGLIFFSSYLAVIPLQNWIYQKKGHWNLFFELLTVCLGYTLCFIGCYLYYKSDIMNGDYTFFQFIAEIYLPTLIIISSILLFGRWFISRKKPEKIIEKVEILPQKLILRGDNKSDVLQIFPVELVAISSAQNYVEVHYLLNDILQKKLLRTTLKKIGRQTPHLVQVHRSHLINPTHFVAWKNTNNIQLHDLVIPVSSNYKNDFLHYI